MMTVNSPDSLRTDDPQVSVLWEKLRRFSFDRGTGLRTFAVRLASEQGWSEAFTRLAIEEYRRFVLLFALDKRERVDFPGAMAEPNPVRIVPSAVVDKVWHLHLLYTQSYWEDLCRDILAGPLHHLPADGSSGEAPALDVVYAHTLEAYRRTFGHDAPVSVWPESAFMSRPGPVGARSARAFAGVTALVFGGSLVAVMVVLGGVVWPGFFLLAVFAAMVVLAAANHRHPKRGRGRSGGDVGSGDGGDSGYTSSGGSTDTSHDGGHHGGSHDAGGHSHSCGGGHSCGGHGCGGHGCGGGGCGGH